MSTDHYAEAERLADGARKAEILNDEALVEEVGEAIIDTLDEMAPHCPSGCLGCGPLWNVTTAYEAARAVLAHLAATGRLVGDDEWQPGRWWRSVGPDGRLWGESSDEAAIRNAARPGDRIDRSWRMEREEWRPAGPGRPAGTIVGPWVEVEG